MYSELASSDSRGKVTRLWSSTDRVLGIEGLVGAGDGPSSERSLLRLLIYYLIRTKYGPQRVNACLVHHS